MFVFDTNYVTHVQTRNNACFFPDKTKNHSRGGKTFSGPGKLPSWTDPLIPRSRDSQRTIISYSSELAEKIFFHSTLPRVFAFYSRGRKNSRPSVWLAPANFEELEAYCTSSLRKSTLLLTSIHRFSILVRFISILKWNCANRTFR